MQPLTTQASRFAVLQQSCKFVAAKLQPLMHPLIQNFHAAVCSPTSMQPLSHCTHNLRATMPCSRHAAMEAMHSCTHAAHVSCSNMHLNAQAQPRTTPYPTTPSHPIPSFRWGSMLSNFATALKFWHAATSRPWVCAYPPPSHAPRITFAVRVHRMGAKADRRRGVAWRWDG